MTENAKLRAVAEKAPAPRLPADPMLPLSLGDVQECTDMYVQSDGCLKRDFYGLAVTLNARVKAALLEMWAAEKAAPAAPPLGCKYGRCEHPEHEWKSVAAATPLNADEIVEACAKAVNEAVPDASASLGSLGRPRNSFAEQAGEDAYAAVMALKGKFSLATPQVREETKS